MSFERIFTDDTVLVFVNGDTVKGAKEVGNVIVGCCRAYTAGYMKVTTPIILVTGAVLGAGITTIVVGVRNEIKDKKIQNYVKSKLGK